MSGILKMPRMGETMDEGQLVAWLVKPGEPFKRGDPILEVETDKTVVEFPALGNGTLIESLVEIGEMVSVGTAIAKIDLGGGPDWTGGDNDDKPTEAKSPAESLTSIPSSSTPAEPVTKDSVDNVVGKSPASPENLEGKKLRATPLARRIAREANIDLASIKGTGRRGRIESRDLNVVSLTTADVKQGHGVAWAEKGAGQGSPIFFIHGFAADHTAWSGLQSQMSRAGHPTLAVDLPSHGVAFQDAHDVSELAKPVIELVQTKYSSQPLHLVAHSMGALVALAVAQAAPVASLTLIAPAGVGRTINTHFLDALVKPRDVASVARVLTRLTHGPNGLSEAAHEAIYNDLIKGRIAGIAQSLAGASGQSVDIRDELAQIAKNIPVSLLLGHRDQVVDWTEALEISALVSVHHFPDVGHMPHWEALPKVQAILERQISS